MTWGMRKYLEDQATAISQTVRLVTLFGIATVITALCTSAILTYVLILVLYVEGVPVEDFKQPLLAAFAFLSIVTGLTMGAASWYKMQMLKEGGKVIALDLGGILLERHSSDRYQTRVLNVVEELAISANLPVPAVYLLDREPGINAFAAGLTPEDAIIGVTRGCITRLNRDQLQGVIAHEFSHICNGDMRLNLRLVGALYGILGIMLLAEIMLIGGYEMLTSPRSDHDGNDWGTGLLLMITGAFLWPIGLIGGMTAYIIMSATSRQREFLADASAVELTRLPDGLAGALKVLAGYEMGSRVRSAKAREASHFFFAAGSRMLGWLATHPPIEERIRALDPHWDGVPLFEEESQLEKSHTAFESTMAMFEQPKGLVSALSAGGPDVASSVGETPETTQASFCDPTSPGARWYQQYRSEVQEELPKELFDLLQDGDGIQVVLQTLWIARAENPQAALRFVPTTYRPHVSNLLPLVLELATPHQTLLLDDAIAHLRKHPTTCRDALRRAMSESLEPQADDEDLTRWAWRHEYRLTLGLDQVKTQRPLHGSLAPVREACEVMLSLMCHTGHENEAMAGYAFQRAAVHLDLPEVEFWPREAITIQQLDVALEMISEAAPRARRKFFMAIGCCVTADQGVSEPEADLLRGICLLLGLPKPSVLPGQPAMPGT